MPSLEARVSFVKKTDDEAQPVQRTDHRDIEGTPSGPVGVRVHEQRISDATFYKWRSKYGGMEISDDLKKLTESTLDAVTLKEMIRETFKYVGRGEQP